MREILVPNSRN